uniref:Uncharacterized protein n=1 Tax=Strigamia maritima TaxID=126957 RepID=T1JLL7_STRMM
MEVNYHVNTTVIQTEKRIITTEKEVETKSAIVIARMKIKNNILFN